MNASGPDSIDRFARRQWRRRLQSGRPWLLGALAVAAVVFGGWVVMVSSWLGVGRVDVQGTHRVPVSEVQGAAGVSPGTPLARINPGSVAARVEAIPAVASADVHRDWPHTLVIQVTERQPVAAVHQHSEWWLMDRTGTLFANSDSPDPAEPIVEIDGSPGQETLHQVAIVLGALPTDLAVATKRVTASTTDSIALHLKDGSEVRWGTAADSVEKARVLAALLPSHALYYDVSAPSQPATKGRLEASG